MRNATPFVDVNKCFPRDTITEIELTHPLVGSTAAADDDQMKRSFYQKRKIAGRSFISSFSTE
jgi:hypothetical protein